MTEHPNLASALVAALSSLSVVEKDQTAKVKMKTGGEYTYNYTDLGSIVKRTRTALADEGLALLQPIVGHEMGYAVNTVLLHGPTGDEKDLGLLPFPRGADAQATGSWITYMRRYALLAALGMATGEDDDGAKALPREEPTTPGYVRSVVAARDKLTEPERASLRQWMAEQGMPAVPSKLTESEADAVCDYILNGLPAVDA
jgi:hypothetical protein